MGEVRLQTRDYLGADASFGTSSKDQWGHSHMALHQGESQSNAHHYISPNQIDPFVRVARY
jgi:hypothetical protein